MDMYMPRFNGVEATHYYARCRRTHRYRSCIFRRIRRWDAGRALRLGGDQFIIKVIQSGATCRCRQNSRIERFRETQRSTRLDGLTGLLNHTAAKSQLKQMIRGWTRPTVP